MTIAPLQRSSGDPIADRRADYAEMLFAEGDAAAAAELFMGALELAPGWALGWFRLGEFYEAADLLHLAEEAYRTCLSLDPADRPGAELKLAVIGAIATPTAPPSGFVEALFDHYASTFDASLVGKLGYRVPDLLESAILAAPHSPSAVRFELALDLGCGTGLMGERLRPLAAKLVGFDISTGMLKKAMAKQIYDGLERADLQQLGESSVRPDLAVAADVFMYIGALDGVFGAIAAMLKPGGLFAFSVEAHDGQGFALRDSRRFAHSQTYVCDQLSVHGFELISLERETIRMDRNAPIEGLIVVASRRQQKALS